MGPYPFGPIIEPEPYDPVIGPFPYDPIIGPEPYCPALVEDLLHCAPSLCAHASAPPVPPMTTSATASAPAMSHVLRVRIVFPLSPTSSSRFRSLLIRLD